MTDRPVRTLVNTHHHGDHTFGNYLFARATIVGHERAREAIRAWGPPRSAALLDRRRLGRSRARAAVPDLHRPGRPLRRRPALPRSATSAPPPTRPTTRSCGSPSARLLFCGDLLFNGGTPFLLHGLGRRRARGAGARGSRSAPRRSCPGTARSAVPRCSTSVADYLRFVLATSPTRPRGRAAPLEAARETDLGEFADRLDAERIVGNLHRAYAELAGEPSAPRSTLAAACGHGHLQRRPPPALSTPEGTDHALGQLPRARSTAASTPPRERHHLVSRRAVPCSSCSIGSLGLHAAHAARNPSGRSPRTEADLLAPVPRPPSIRDFMAFEEHVVTASAAIGLTGRPALVRPARLLLHQPGRRSSAPTTTSRSRRAAQQYDYELEVGRRRSAGPAPTSARAGATTTSPATCCSATGAPATCRPRR